MPANGKGIEFDFCKSWESWDEVDVFALQFNDVVLLPEVAKIVGRDRVDCMCIFADKRIVEFYDGDDFEFQLKFKVQIVVDSE